MYAERCMWESATVGMVTKCDGWTIHAEGVVMRYEKPEITDFGSITDHTFTTPGGQVKGGKPPSKPDEHGELSHEETGGS